MRIIELSEVEVVQDLDTMLRCLDCGDFDLEPRRLVVIALLVAWSKETQLFVLSSLSDKQTTKPL